MNAYLKFGAILVVLVAVIASRAEGAEGTSSSTTLTIQGMHCGGCAKKISGKLQTVAGVEKTEVDVRAGLMVVSPKPRQVPSPRLMWEAVEKAGYKIMKLEGPTGTFTEKPKS